MTARSYQNFDLQIEKTGDSYRARVLDSPAGQAQCDLTLPFSAVEIENFVLRMGQRRGTLRRVESSNLDAARAFGTSLFRAVMDGDVAGAYRSSLSWVEQHGTGLRIRLRLSEAADLIDIPWEFLYDPTARRFVALSVDSPIVRFLDVSGATERLKVEPPVRLLVVIASPSDLAPLDVELEWSRLHEAVAGLVTRGQLAIERLEKPTLQEFQRALRQPYHVLHFVGHGGFDERSQDGLLVFEDDNGRSNPVSATYVATLLHDADSLRLAVLNACDGARSSLTDEFAGVAQALLLQGVPAVVAMQFEITDSAAITFAQEFYGAFAEGYPVEAALGEARKSIFALQNDSEWATPVLYLRSPDGSIFDIKPSAAAPVEVPVEPAPEPSVETPRTIPPVVPVPVGPRDTSRDAAEPPPGPEPGSAPEPEPQPEALGPGGAPPLRPPRDPWRRRFGRRGALLAGGGGAAALAVVIAAAISFNGGGGNNGDDGTPDTTATDTPTAITATFEGTWWTNWARVELTQSGDQVSGSYFPYFDNRKRSLDGTITDLVFNGQFDKSGQVMFQLAGEGQSFAGSWFDANGGSHEWCGQRDSKALEDGCGFDGDWQVKGLPTAFALQDGTVRIEQTADTMTMAFTSRTYGNVTVPLTSVQGVAGKASGTAKLRASGSASLEYAIDWLVKDEIDWDSFTGTWRAITPANGGSGSWCAWRGSQRPPC